MQSRRHFFKTLLGILAAGGVALKSGLARAKKLGLKINKVPVLAKVGGSATVKLAGKEILLIRSGTSTVHGVNPKCTHQNCPVKYNPKTQKLDCHCHGSSFDLSGKVQGGPATKNLKTYPSTLKDGTIIISVD